MATSLPKALSWDDYKSREPGSSNNTKRFMAALNDENRHLANPDDDRAGAQEDDYAGNDPRQPLPERISIVAIVKRSPLNVPSINGGMDERTATQAATQYYEGILQAGGQRALNLIRGAASEGNKAVIKARELGQKDDFHVVAGHNGAAQAAASLVAAALEQYPATREDAQSSVYSEDTNHEESARATLAKAKNKDFDRKGFQKLPTDADKVDFKKILESFRQNAPKLSTARIHPESVSKEIRKGVVRDQDPDSLTFKKAIGFTDEMKAKIDPAFHETVLAHENSTARYGSLKAPVSAFAGMSLRPVSQSRAIFCDPKEVYAAKTALQNAGKDEEIIIGSKANELGTVKTQARVSKVHFEKASTMALEKMGFDGTSARYLKNGMQMIDHADTVDMFMDKEPNKLNGYLLGYAASQGKIGTVTKGNKTLTLAEAQAEGAANYMSMAAATRRSLSQGFDVDLSDPAAAVGMTLLRDEKDGVITPKDIRAIQSVPDMTLLDVVEAVQTDEGAAQFQAESRVSAQAIRLLRNEQAVANAGRNLSHVLETITRNGHGLVGRDGMPESLRNMENGPNFAIISGDVSKFVNADKTVGVFGEYLRNDSDKDAELASRIAPTLNEIDKTGITRVMMDKATPFPIEPKDGDIVVLNGGLGVFANDTDRESQDERDMAGAVTVSFDQVPSIEVYKAGPRGKKGEIVEIENHGTDASAPRAARYASAMSSRLVVTNGNDLSERNPTKAAITQQLLEGKRVVAVDPGATNASKLTSALVNNKGRKALEAAGYGASTVEDPRLKPVEGGYVAMRSGSDPAKTAAHIKSLVTTGQPIAQQKSKTKTREDQR